MSLTLQYYPSQDSHNQIVLEKVRLEAGRYHVQFEIFMWMFNWWESLFEMPESQLRFVLFQI